MGIFLPIFLPCPAEKIYKHETCPGIKAFIPNLRITIRQHFRFKDKSAREMRQKVDTEKVTLDKLNQEDKQPR